MSKFIYVFTREAYDEMVRDGYELLRTDEKNQVWVFANKDPDNLEFSTNHQVVLSNVLTF